MKILGIIGVAGSGKTTLSNQLEKYGWHKTRFAAPLKSMLTELLRYQGVVDTQLILRMIEGDLKEIPTKYFNDRTPRYTMQTLGTEWRDLIDRNLWVDIWKRSILNLPQNSKIVVDDCRFVHEAKEIQNLGGKLVYIYRPNTTTTSIHISETEMATIPYDATIMNDAYPEKMLDQLGTILEYWK